jgi:Diacylglycerol kinase catalytic domain
MKFSWPEAAFDVQLIVPRSYRVNASGPSSKSSPATEDDQGSSALCHIEYCSPSGVGGITSDSGGEEGRSGGWLKIVSSDESRTVLDVMCVDDVIGASVEFAMTATADPSDSAQATAATTGTSNGGKDEKMLELVSPPATPRAPTELLADTQGHATLHVYCYPKVSNRLSLLQKLGVKSKPTPRVPDRSMLDEDSGNGDGYLVHSSAAAGASPSPRMAAHRAFVLAPVEDLGQIQDLVRAIRQLARSVSAATSADPPPPKAVRERYLVLVNPISGKGHAEADARRTVVPMLEQAGIECEVVVTKHRGHAHEICVEGGALLNGITGIVVVAGDGVFHEVVNALASTHCLEKYTLGMVPCGTGSGLAASMAHYGNEECTVVSSTFTIWYVCNKWALSNANLVEGLEPS